MPGAPLSMQGVVPQTITWYLPIFCLTEGKVVEKKIAHSGRFQKIHPHLLNMV